MGHDIEIGSGDLSALVFSRLSQKEKQEAVDKAQAILRAELRPWEERFEKLEVQAMISGNREGLENEIDQWKWQVKRLCKRLALRKVASEMYKKKIHKKERKRYEDSLLWG